MIVNIPKIIRIGSYDYKILSGVRTNLELEAAGHFGNHSNVLCEIKIADKYGEDHVRDTFIHECLEAIATVWCNNDLEHRHISNIAQGLSQIFKDLGLIFRLGGEDVTSSEPEPATVSSLSTSG